MDDQQETSWFSGILEAEGCCPELVGNRAQINITNTDLDIVEACVSYLSKRSIPHTVRKEARNRPLKDVYKVSLYEENTCYTLIKVLGAAFQCRRQEFLRKLGLDSSTTLRETPLRPDLYWLVGLTEGEGYFGLELDQGRYYYPVVSIKNTKETIIEKLALSLRASGLSWCVNSYDDGNPRHKRIFSVRIRGMQRCRRFFMKTKGLWVSGYYAYYAEKLLEFINSRIVMSSRTPYTEAQRQLYWVLKR